MKTSIKPIPEGFHTVTPYLLVPDVPAVIDFLKKVFNAKEMYRSTAPDGVVNHASVQIGNSIVMMGAGRGSWQPETATLYVYLEEMDSVYFAGCRGRSGIHPGTQSPALRGSHCGPEGPGWEQMVPRYPCRRCGPRRNAAPYGGRPEPARGFFLTF